MLPLPLHRYGGRKLTGICKKKAGLLKQTGFNIYCLELIFLEQKLFGEALVFQNLALLLQRIHLNLTDTFTGNTEFTSNILKRGALVIV